MAKEMRGSVSVVESPLAKFVFFNTSNGGSRRLAVSEAVHIASLLDGVLGSHCIAEFDEGAIPISR